MKNVGNVALTRTGKCHQYCSSRHVRTVATDANWATAQKSIIAFEESNQLDTRYFFKKLAKKGKFTRTNSIGSDKLRMQSQLTMRAICGFFLDFV